MALRTALDEIFPVFFQVCSIESRRNVTVKVARYHAVHREILLDLCAPLASNDTGWSGELTSTFFTALLFRHKRPLRLIFFARQYAITNCMLGNTIALSKH